MRYKKEFWIAIFLFIAARNMRAFITGLQALLGA